MHKFLDWAALENELNILAERVNINPDMLLSAPDGGFIVAYLLSKKLNVPNVNVVQDNLDVNGKNVVVVFDVVKDGKSDELKRDLEAKGAQVKVAALYKQANNNVDFFVDEVEEAMFPWSHN